jgi:PAS domain S-box-containing protein
MASRTMHREIKQDAKWIEAQKESDEKYKAIFQGAAEGILISDIKTLELKYANPATCKMLGYCEEELRRMTVSDIHPKESLGHVISEFEAQEKGKKAISMGIPFLRKDGSIMFAIINTSKALIDGIACNLVFISDITRIKWAEEEIRASEARYRILAENVHDGVGILRDEKLVFVNTSFGSIFGYTPEQLTQKDPIVLFHDNHKQSFKEFCEEFNLGIPAESMQVQCIRGDGSEIWAEIDGNIVEWEGNPAVLITLRDVTESKIRELTLAEERESLHKENVNLKATLQDRYRFGDIIGKSSAMQQVYELIIKSSASDASVIIYGESGTGKDLIAQTIHDLSNRHDKPFVPVNCGAVPESLFESEFFGYRKGAFTGAHVSKHGFFDLAHEGTLFLDEVGQLTLNMQAKLLRAIEGRGYMPVGGNKIKKADFRIIAATNKNLIDMVRKGLMRDDFFYRLHIIPIFVPPLRERMEDISLLVEHILQSENNDNKKHLFSGRIIDKLCDYHWPGNVRELQNVIQRYILLGHLDFMNLSKTLSAQCHDFADKKSDEAKLVLPDAIARIEETYISQALSKNSWNRSSAAVELGISRKTLFRKMKSLGLQ